MVGTLVLATVAGVAWAASIDCLSGNTRDNPCKGTRKADFITGTTGSDYILARGGGDQVYPWSGNDEVYGGGGPDEIFGILPATIIFTAGEAPTTSMMAARVVTLWTPTWSLAATALTPSTSETETSPTRSVVALARIP